MQDDEDMDSLVYAIGVSPEAPVLGEWEMERFMLKVKGKAEIWMYGERFMADYMDLKKKAERLLLNQDALSKDEVHKNKKLMEMFEPIEDEESLI